MAIPKKALIATLVLSLLVLDLVQATNNNPMDCGAACTGRCSLSSRPRLCKRACGTCCSRCQCVPPGTTGNLDLCPCYAALTTRNNQRKCP